MPSNIGWSAAHTHLNRTLITFLRENLCQYYVVNHQLYKVLNSNIYQFVKYHNTHQWIEVHPSLSLLVEPVSGVTFDTEIKKVEEKPPTNKTPIDFTKNLETTSGLPARLLINDFWESTNQYCFLCLIKDPAASHDLIRSFNKFGECGVQSNLRLRNCPKKISIERFVNIHRNGSMHLYEKQEAALANKSKDHIATAVPITINTIEGFDPRNIA